MKILINQMPKLVKKSFIYAFGKARADINTAFTECGYPVENVECVFYKFPFRTSLNILFQYLKLVRKYKGQHEYIFQYPVSCDKVFLTIIKYLHAKGNKVTILIHDIQTFRYRQNHEKEIAWLNSADRIIVHTEAMQAILQKNGVHTPMDILHLFDYYSDDDFLQEKEMLSHRNEVVFAGNLAKSQFLPALYKMPVQKISFNLYGNKDNLDLSSFAHINYGGIFNSDHTGKTKGGWGLVWDGKSIDTCNGPLGEYLSYNLPHKLSLYLAAGLPVIVWKGSAVAPFIVQHKLGIAVNSIQEIENIILHTSEETYLNYIYNCRRQGKILRSGGMIKKLIQ